MNTPLFRLLPFLVVSSALAETAPTLRTTTVSKADVYRTVTLPAGIIPDKSATLYAKVPGYLKIIRFDKGDRVKAGETIAELEAPELTADLIAREARAKITRTNLERMESSIKSSPGSVSPQDADTVRSESQVAEAELARTRTLVDYCRITAPFDGVVTGRFVDPGAFVPAATGSSVAQTPAIVSITAQGRLRLRVFVPEDESSRIDKGTTLRFSVPALPGKVFAANISRTYHVLDEATHSLPAEADVDDADGRLLPGMYASVTLDVERHSGVTAVPAKAVLSEKSGDSVFLVSGGMTKKTPVKTGFKNSDLVEITSGLTGSETVVIFGDKPPADGTPVTAAR